MSSDTYAFILGFVLMAYTALAMVVNRRISVGIILHNLVGLSRCLVRSSMDLVDNGALYRQEPTADYAPLTLPPHELVVRV